MNFLIKLFAALSSEEQSFSMAWRRISHSENGHPFDGSTKLETFVSQHHPDTEGLPDMQFVIHMRQCGSCGLIFYDTGLEYKDLAATRAKYLEEARAKAGTIVPPLQRPR